jgi:uroporphyrinogen-III synthase/AcrR family transcriptional regulator
VTTGSLHDPADEPEENPAPEPTHDPADRPAEEPAPVPAFVPRGRRPDPGKRERIIEAASGLFGGRDLASVRMEEVAARAGVAKGTIYLYFHSKEELYFSILATRLSLLLDALDQAFREEEDPRVRLHKFLLHSSMFLLKYPDFFRMMRKEESRLAGAFPGPELEVEPLRARLRDLLRCLLTRGIEAGRVRRMPVKLAADLVFGALEGTVRRCLDEGGAAQRHNPAPAFLFDFVWRAVREEKGEVTAMPRAENGEVATPRPPDDGGTVRPRPAAPGSTCLERFGGAVVAITREEEPGEGLSAEVARLGGRPLPISVLGTEAPVDAEALRAAARVAADYAWILFTSARGVEPFAAAWRAVLAEVPREASPGTSPGSSAQARSKQPLQPGSKAGRPEIPATTRIGAVGPATAHRAKKLLGRCDCTAAESSGAGLAHELLRTETLRGARLLVVRAEDGRPELSEILRGAGAFVDEVVAYRTVAAVIDAAPLRTAFHEGSIAAVAFASPSAVQAFVGQIGAAWLGGPEGHTLIATIGPSTTAAVRALGLEPSAEAETPSLRELARAAARAVQTKQGVNP